jgi:hypothetical protein
MNTGSARLGIPVLKLLALVVVANTAVSTAAVRDPRETQDEFDFSKINEGVTKEFLKAWNYSHNGVDKIEAVVLIYRKIDGSYFANALGRTNETEKFRFKWDPAAIAIAHTHPTSIDPKPSRGDMELSDRLHIPIFTMTQSGMYMYNPSVKRTIKIKEGLDWLDPFRWVHDSD